MTEKMPPENNNIETLLQNIHHRYGYDFTKYSEASISRRIQLFYTNEKYFSFMEMQNRLLQDPVYFMYFVESITVNVTEMFRDASFYQMIRKKIIPVLATYPFIRIWHAGCSTGEEVFSLAILLKEAGLQHKCISYATDINPAVLEKARKGKFPIGTMKQNSENYIKAGGEADFSSYYKVLHNFATFDKALSANMIFSTHNLVTDSSFNEFQLILCRNVLIYFDRDLQSKVLELFDKSLDSLGFLALGTKESLRFSDIATHYKQLDSKEKIWRKLM